MTPLDRTDIRLGRTDAGIDRATAARLRDEARRSRDRIERRLAAAGHLPGGVSGPRPVGDAIDERRNLSRRLDENVTFYEHIDALHERRLHSPSPRERQVATRALAEALHRIVAGYQVADDPPHRPVLVARALDEWLGRAYDRLAASGPRRDGATRWWARDGRWVRLALALVAGVLLSENHVVAAAMLVCVRSLLSVALYAPAPPVGRRRRLLGYDPQWGTCISTHLGDAAILTGMGLGLHLGGSTEWGAATVFAALFGVITKMMRVASGQHGFRLPRLWLDRAVTTAVLPAVVVAAALPLGGLGTLAGLPVGAVAVGVVTLIGLVEIGRTVYYALCRRRLFRRASESGFVPDAIVAHTADGIVVNLSRAGGSVTVFDMDGEAPAHLHAVGEAPGPPATIRSRRTRPRVSRP